MALIKNTDFKGMQANYHGKYNLSYDKATNKTTFILYLYWSKEAAESNPLVQLDSVKWEYGGNLSATQCYELVKADERFAGATDNL